MASSEIAKKHALVYPLQRAHSARQWRSILAGAVVCAALGLVGLPAKDAFARDQIQIVGSSTVYPFVAAAAEEFGKSSGFRTPVVEATGTGGGFKLFCSGADINTPDMVNASRPIKASEVARCKENGVERVLEIAIGYDGIVLANARQEPPLRLTLEQLFLALAKEVPVRGALVPNPYHTWREIAPELPAKPIQVYGPPATSGTRDAFVEIAMEKGCAHFKEFAARYPDEKERKNACHLLREDGAFITAGEDDNLLIQKLVSNREAFGLFGFSFLEENADKVHPAVINGAAPTVEDIADGSYSIARSLYVYAKLEHAALVPGVKEFLQEITSTKAMGEDGYLAAKGLVPLPESLRKNQASKVQLALESHP